MVHLNSARKTQAKLLSDVAGEGRDHPDVAYLFFILHVQIYNTNISLLIH